MWVNRFQHETTVTVLFPNNPVACKSVARYIEVMKSVYARVADSRRDRPLADSRRAASPDASWG